MTSNQADGLTPLATPLPEGPAGEVLTAGQWTTLMAIMDAVIPSIRRETTTTDKILQLTVSDVEYNTAVSHLKKTVVDAPDGKSLDEYLDERPSENPRFQELFMRTLAFYVRPDARKELSFLLSTLK
jgi:hypothetical protein